MIQNNHVVNLQGPLYGQTIYLRPPVYDELKFIQHLWSDPETMKPVGGPVVFSEERQGEWFKRMVKPGTPDNFYCLIFNTNDTPVGEISFHRWSPEIKSADLNMKVLAIYRGKGYAKEALSLFLDYFFNVFGGNKMQDDVALDNFSGQQLLRAFGFQQDPTTTDVSRMYMTKEMFKERHRYEK